MVNRTRSEAAAGALLAVTALVLLPTGLPAYGGPGSIVSGIGALLAVVGALLAAVFGFAWYPVKRLLRAIRDDDGAGAEADATER